MSEDPKDPDDPIWTEEPKLSVVGDQGKLVFKPARLPDPDKIPPRSWLYGTQLLRGFVSLLVAPGGTGKSLYAMGVGVSVATTLALYGEHIFTQGNVALLNLEDPMEELDRRLAALMIHHHIKRDAIAGKFFMHSGEEREVKIARWADDNSDIVYPDSEALIREIEAHNIVVLIIDPFAESHDLEENSNPQMVAAMRAWRRIARFTNCAILLVHHVRKGVAQDIESVRGAKAQSDSARVGLIMSSMSTADAAELAVEEADRLRYIRLDDAKANMAARAEAKWFRLVDVALDNGTPEYPNGDTVAALERWQPPTLFAGLTDEQCNQTLDLIDVGMDNRRFYTASRRGAANNRFVGPVIMQGLGVTEMRAIAILNVWLMNGLLYEKIRRNPETRKKEPGLAVNATKRPGPVA